MLYYKLTITNRQASQGETAMAGYLGFEATDTKPYIFISYAHANAPAVMQVVEELSARGYRVWYDDGIWAKR